MAHSGGGDAAEWLGHKAMWLAANEPAVHREPGSFASTLTG